MLVTLCFLIFPNLIKNKLLKAYPYCNYACWNVQSCVNMFMWKVKKKVTGCMKFFFFFNAICFCIDWSCNVSNIPKGIFSQPGLRLNILYYRYCLQFYFYIVESNIRTYQNYNVIIIWVMSANNFMKNGQGSQIGQESAHKRVENVCRQILKCTLFS